MHARLRATSIFLATIVLSAASWAQQDSGFLGDNYSKLQDAQSPSGAKVKRWLAPGFAPGQYDSVMLEKTVLYPEAQGTDQVSAATLSAITAYLDEALRRELAEVVKLTDQPGPTTLRIKPAITAAASENKDLKAYQLIPVALVFTMAKRAAGAGAKQAALSVEFEVRDGGTNEVVGVGVRQGTQAIDNPAGGVTVETVKPAIDAWAKDAKMFFEAKPGK